VEERQMMTDCVVLGAGPAGLAASVALTQVGVEHVILERSQAGDTWRTQRWDSFRLNTPGWMNQLLGGQERYGYADHRAAQYHTADYSGPGQLPDGAVLVVGSGQSGCQIAEDLLIAGRRVLLATSPVIFFGFPRDAAAVADAVKAHLDGS
jgi:cation diffusion facilitator CzcD-associated flavoprotein CzcO